MSSFKWRCSVRRVNLRRVDDVEEDDFKTWALIVVKGSSGAQSQLLWYPNADGAAPDANAALGKTSVRPYE